MSVLTLLFLLFGFRVSWITRQETPRSSFCASCVTSSASSGGCSERRAHPEDLCSHWESPGRTDRWADGCGAPCTTQLPPCLSPRTHGGAVGCGWTSHMELGISRAGLCPGVMFTTSSPLCFITFLFFQRSLRENPPQQWNNGISLSSFLETHRLLRDKPCSGEKENLSQLMGRAALVCLAETHGALPSPFASWASACGRRITMMEEGQRAFNQHFFSL